MGLPSKLWRIIPLFLTLSEAKPRSAYRNRRLSSFVVTLYPMGVGITPRGAVWSETLPQRTIRLVYGDNRPASYVSM